MKKAFVAGLGLLASACATPLRSAEKADGQAEGRAAPDLVRAQRLADALQVRGGQIRPVAGTMKLGFSPEALRAGESGSAIVAFVVKPNGRVDRDSRTLVYVEGHQIFAKYVCDALLAAKFEPRPADPRGSVSAFPVFFYIKDGPPRDSARVKLDQAQRTIGRRFASMTYDEAHSWFAARPSCSAIRIGLEPLYGPPPE
jgi:hypothetical protein